ncbi:MAG: DUF6498-containing protein [Candidatus Margulisbacteria bacterium]|jgi:hypothetical protein|nr:DUF6498-containing protein [Candidatus Margulisiibacteriota bacterium]
MFGSSSKDPSLWSLLAVNLLTIALAVKFNWSVLELMWIYWGQSVTIGAFNVVRLRPNIGTATFFALHFGFFHLIYAIFLSVFTLAGDELFPGAAPIDWRTVLGVVGMFAANHGFSFLYNRERDAARFDESRLMFYPYVRIFPMHLTIIFGALLSGTFPLLLFMGLKTAADLATHILEHR